MADFDRSEEFRRNLRQLRMLRAQGYAFESVPLGGDALSRGNVQEQRDADAALQTLDMRLRREQRTVQTLERKVSRLEGQYRNLKSPNRQSLMEQLRAEGYGIKASRAGWKMPGIQLGKRGFRMDWPSLAGGHAMTALGTLYALKGLEDTVWGGVEKYVAMKKAGGTEGQAIKAYAGEAAEGVASGLANALSKVPGVSTAHKLFGRGDASLKQAVHMWERAAAFMFNRGELQKREAARANAELAAHSELDHKFDKLITTGPKTFRLKNAAHAEIFRRDKLDATQVLRESEHSRLRLAQRNGRIADGN